MRCYRSINKYCVIGKAFNHLKWWLSLQMLSMVEWIHLILTNAEPTPWLLFEFWIYQNIKNVKVYTQRLLQWQNKESKSLNITDIYRLLELQSTLVQYFHKPDILQPKPVIRYSQLMQKRYIRFNAKRWVERLIFM